MTKHLSDNDNAPVVATSNNEALRFLSVCSGIEAASVAWPHWQAIAFSEIEAFPSALLQHYYPDVPNLGDFTKIDTTTLGRVDILCAGTPCQAFSVAGAHGGLNDPRGNLSLAFVGLAHELAGNGTTIGNGLRNVIWENVVGVLSDKTNAFGCFIGGLVGADAAIVPPGGRNGKPGKWTRHGMVAGPKGRVAWAVKDAQFFGVAQRRRRVLVVADFGNGADPAKVLFEPEGVYRNPPSRREAGQGAAAEVAPSLTASGRGVERTGDTRGQDPVVAVGYAPEVARCVATREGSSQDYESTTMVACVTGDVTHSLTAEGHDASEDGSGRGAPIVVHGTQDPCVSDVAFAQQGNSCQENVVCFTAKDYGGVAAVDIAPTLRGGNHDKSHANGGVGPAVTVALRGREGGATAELGGSDATALRASSGGGDKPHVLTSAVRRLTPRECERLMGFPDDYTLIPVRKVSKANQEKARKDDSGAFREIDGEMWVMAADGPRYKALGNSWAVPKFKWLGERVQRFMPPAADNDNASHQPAQAKAA